MRVELWCTWDPAPDTVEPFPNGLAPRSTPDIHGAVAALAPLTNCKSQKPIAAPALALQLKIPVPDEDVAQSLEPVQEWSR